MSRVVVLGSLNVDLVTRVPQHPSPGETVLGEGLRRLAGGKGANQAMAAARAGASVTMVGAVGDDEGGRAYAARLAAAGVDTGALSVVDEPTGTALIVVDDTGENSIVVVAGANATVTADALPDLGPGDVLLVQLEVPLDTVADACSRARGQGARVVLNTAPYADLPDDVLALADPVVANEHEAARLAMTSGTPGSLLVTLGADGARWGDLALPAERVDDVVDTTGAGDAFCGALAAALADGADDEAALRAALAAGARAVRHEGAQPDPAL
ncbi:ribokinase [Nocardioides aequoreus]|uniref:ribokinase n=1 Tax=Nocardioides aequoreus TaxID=397278 RepID=UPI0004C2B930|nr:ribokinase [Nocardioides aequoreus]